MASFHPLEQISKEGARAEFEISLFPITSLPLHLVQTLHTDAELGLPHFGFFRHPTLYCIVGHTARMPHDATRCPLDSVEEAYAISLKRLADFVYGLFTALRCIMMYATIGITFPVAFLSATFYVLVTSLDGVTPWQQAGSGFLPATP